MRCSLFPLSYASAHGGMFSDCGYVELEIGRGFEAKRYSRSEKARLEYQ